jgi:branched-chain amino acid transport system substrate-binding protein
MKGQSFESPRGPVTIDPQTREVIQNVYIRKVERVPALGNQLYNVELDTLPAVRDPGKVK